MTQTATDPPYNVRLVVDANDDHQAATRIAPDGRNSDSFPLALPLTAQDAADLRWYLETYVQFPGTGDRARAAGIEARMEEWGHALFDAVFGTGEGTDVYDALIAAAGNGRSAMLTLETTDPEVLLQPWEMMRDRHGPLVFQGVTIRRQLKDAGKAAELNLELPLRVLMIVSRPRDAGFIDPRTSVAPVLDALDVLPPGQVTVDFCEPPTVARLEEMLSEAREEKRPFHIVHFDGHGDYNPKSGIGTLAFERTETDDRTERVRGEHLGRVLADLDVPLFLLEACQGSSLGAGSVYGSVAPALLRSGVRSVIAFSHTVHVKAARLLVERFYGGLVAGLTVGQALGQARLELRDDPRRWLHREPDADAVDLQDWFIPQLYQSGSDPALVVPGDAAPAPASPARPRRLLGFPSSPMYGFHGRWVELLRLERAFRRGPAVVLTGMGGMGKTALAREAAVWWLRTGRFEDAVFHSFEQKAGADRVIQLLGQALEGDDFSARPAAEQWTAAVELFRRRRVLLVWDNFESTLPAYQQGEDPDSPLIFATSERRRLKELYQELTKGEPAGRLLLTCRPAETGLPGLEKIPLSGLARPDSLHLLGAVLDKRGITTGDPGYERHEIEDLLKTLDDHPLSISLVAVHLDEMTPTAIRRELRERPAGFADPEAEEVRNRSLVASLEFSKKRLSRAARAVLPYLAWFEGGVFEHLFVAFAELNADSWKAVRGELVATALIRVEESFVRFHPTLPYAALSTNGPEVGEAEVRFVRIYLGVMMIVDQALDGAQPAAGMALLGREEANFRSALRRAFRRDDRQAGASMAEILRLYLERSGRLRERDALVAWVRSRLQEDAELDVASCGALRDHSWTLFTHGKADEAIAGVRGLIARLESEGLAGDEDPTFQIATSYRRLGMLYVNAHLPDLALEPTQRAIGLFEGLPGDHAKDNLAAALGDLANAQRALGRFDDALATAERGLAIDREMGRDREIPVDLGRIAEILKDQQRYAEAEERYAEALRAARDAGYLGLQGTCLQHQAILQREMGNPGRAVGLGKKAMTLFQQAGDAGGEMRTCNLLGSAEENLGHLEAAAAWYDRSRELAVRLNDRATLGAIAQNVGLLHQALAEQTDDPDVRAGHLRAAVSSIEESLAIKQEMENQVGAALSYFELGVLHHMLGEFDGAEVHLRQSLAIRESLNLPDVWKDYTNLADVARDRGDAEAAAEWQAKYDAKVAELKQRWIGVRADAVPRQLFSTVRALAVDVYGVRMEGRRLPPEAAEAMTQLSSLPAPLGAVGTFFAAFAGGGPVPEVPQGLPSELGEVLEGLVGSVATSATGEACDPESVGRGITSFSTGGFPGGSPSPRG